MIKEIRKYILYALSAVLVTYVIVTIGPANIYDKLISANPWMVFAGSSVALLAALTRIYKYKLLLDNKDMKSILEIFVLSRIGKEVSFAGYFIPLLQKNNQKDGTLSNLLIDRYTEIFSTLALATISCFFVLGKGYLETIIFITIAGCTLLMVILPFLRTRQLTKRIENQYILRLANMIDTLQVKLKFNSTTLRIYALSTLSTVFDFLTALFILKSCGADVDMLSISVVWAASALASILAFMIVGSTEVSVIYLYKFLNGINEAVTASFLILCRLVNIFILSLLFLWLLVWGRFKSLSPSPTTDRAVELLPNHSTISNNDAAIQ